MVRPGKYLYRRLDVVLGTSRMTPCENSLMRQNSDNLKGAFVPVAINTLTQLYYVFALRNSSTPTYQSKLTNIVNITFAGVYVSLH